MKKTLICGFLFIIIISIIHYNNYVAKISHQYIFTNKGRIKRQLSNSNETQPENGIRFKNANESANISYPDISSIKKRDLIRRFKEMWPVAHWCDLGFFTDDYLLLINEHWMQFPPPNEIVQKFLGSIYIIFATAGCWGNVIVLFMYFR